MYNKYRDKNTKMCTVYMATVEASITAPRANGGNILPGDCEVRSTVIVSSKC